LAPSVSLRVKVGMLPWAADVTDAASIGTLKLMLTAVPVTMLLLPLVLVATSVESRTGRTEATAAPEVALPAERAVLSAELGLALLDPPPPHPASNNADKHAASFKAFGNGVIFGFLSVRPAGKRQKNANLQVRKPLIRRAR
jgi:hypothetical protein